MRVLVRNAIRPSVWDVGLLLEWRWLDDDHGLWEACVNTAAGTAWVSGDRLEWIGEPVVSERH